MKTIISAFAMSAALATTAVAQDTEMSDNRVAAVTAWSVFVENDPTECWVVSAPEETVNTRDGVVVSVRRGEILMFVTYRPGEGVSGELSFAGGYPFAEGSTVTVTVGEQSFELFTTGESAWPPSESDDAQLMTAMKRGTEAVVVGMSARGTRTEDTFSLYGFTAALEEAQSRCSG